MKKQLYRSCDNSMLGGVAGGLGEYFDIDPTIVRLIWALCMLSFVGIAAYVIAWVLIPLDPKCQSEKSGADEIKERAEKFAKEVQSTAKKYHHKRNKELFFVGLFIIAVGTLLLAGDIFGFSFWRAFLPVIVIILGVGIVAGALER